MHMEEDPCEICETKTDHEPISESDQPRLWECEYCGPYHVSDNVLPRIRELNHENQVKVSGWIRKQNRETGVPLITDSTLDSILSRPIPGIEERANNILLEASHGQSGLKVEIKWKDPKYQGA